MGPVGEVVPVAILGPEPQHAGVGDAHLLAYRVTVHDVLVAVARLQGAGSARTQSIPSPMTCPAPTMLNTSVWSARATELVPARARMASAAAIQIRFIPGSSSARRAPAIGGAP